MNSYKSYSDKLKDPKWQKKRLEVLNRDEWKCQMCNDTESTLHVHHFCYDTGGNPWDVDDTALITYCHVCHLIVEQEKIYPISVVKYKKSEGVTIVFVLYVVDDETILSLYHAFKDTLIHQSTFRNDTLKAMVRMFEAVEGLNYKKLAPMG